MSEFYTFDCNDVNFYYYDYNYKNSFMSYISVKELINIYLKKNNFNTNNNTNTYNNINNLISDNCIVDINEFFNEINTNKNLDIFISLNIKNENKNQSLTKDFDYYKNKLCLYKLINSNIINFCKIHKIESDSVLIKQININFKFLFAEDETINNNFKMFLINKYSNFSSNNLLETDNDNNYKTLNKNLIEIYTSFEESLYKIKKNYCLLYITKNNYIEYNINSLLNEYFNEITSKLIVFSDKNNEKDNNNRYVYFLGQKSDLLFISELIKLCKYYYINKHSLSFELDDKLNENETFKQISMFKNAKKYNIDCSFIYKTLNSDIDNNSLKFNLFYKHCEEFTNSINMYYNNKIFCYILKDKTDLEHNKFNINYFLCSNIVNNDRESKNLPYFSYLIVNENELKKDNALNISNKFNEDNNIDDNLNKHHMSNLESVKSKACICIDNILKSLVYNNKFIISKIIFLNDDKEYKANNTIIILIVGDKDEVEHVNEVLKIQIDYLKIDNN